MHEFFLSKKNEGKLAIYKFLLFSKVGRTEDEIMNEFQLNKTTLKRYMNELEIDLKTVFQLGVMIQYNSFGNLAIMRLPEYTIGYTIDQLRILYIKESSLFQVLTALFSKSYVSVEQLALDLNLSTPHVYKSLAMIKTILKKFGGTIYLSEFGNLEGSELGIRFFSFLIYWNVFKTSTMNPFSTRMIPEFLEIDFLKEKMEIEKNLSISQEMKIRMLHGITCFRLANRKKEIDPTEECLTDIQFFYRGKNSLNLTDFRVDQEVLIKESMILSFFIRGLTFDIDTPEMRREIVESYQKSDLPIARLTEHLLSDFQQQFQFNYVEGNYYESYYLLLFFLLYCKHIHLEVDEYFENPIQKNEQIVKDNPNFILLNQKLTHFIAAYEELSELSKLAKTQLAHLLFFIFDLNTAPPKVKVFVMNNGAIGNGYLIKNGIQEVFHPEILQIVEDPEVADLIISDVYEGAEVKVERFYFNNIYDEKNWERLIQYLSRFIFKKTFFKDSI
ncbi:helix-turn-helix domain-containing protein [Candidatus Enterococcus courvalinii]|uniref:Helix-turn-helix domain-containing protein n=1 Tax=Candidatus Enterococcus courvalinii TaxID=2815329 RepID=A0ABS3I2U7_9ENTE|nr:helix-turn-helix domain-containing protein [Enterococcus sp. MSG2901]MBO0483022.1 helix-turn-helix domain-containing protein [Enterococcus sp. MSG2901]